MSWLLALALFWFVGSKIAKLIDFRHDVSRRHTNVEIDDCNTFFAEVYMISWNYYQPMAFRVDRAMQENGQTGLQAFSELEEQIFKKPIEYKAVECAIKKMLDLELTVYIPNPDSKQRYQSPALEWVKYDGYTYLDIPCTARSIWVKIPRLNAPYSWNTADKVKHEAVMHYIPQRSDPLTKISHPAFSADVDRFYPDTHADKHQT